MNILILFILGLNLVLVPLVAYFSVRTLSSRLDSNARWHRQVLNTEIETLRPKLAACAGSKGMGFGQHAPHQNRE